MSRPLPTRRQAKAQAKHLRAELGAAGTEIGHAQSLELVARRLGFRDWNSFHAASHDQAPENLTPGSRVRGRYMSQPFHATVISIEVLRPGWHRLVLDLDEAVDVVRFDSFSNLRKRIRAVIGPDGHSRERTSDGEPHIRLDL